jgi:hypothetical protein
MLATPRKLFSRTKWRERMSWVREMEKAGIDY